jgi:hypothetical protein
VHLKLLRRFPARTNVIRIVGVLSLRIRGRHFAYFAKTSFAVGANKLA